MTSSTWFRSALIACAFTLVLGCSSKSEKDSEGAAPPPTKTPETTPAETKPAAGGAHATWEAFWPAFQSAAKAKDKAALLELSVIGPDLDQATFDMMVDSFLSAEVIEAITKADAASVKVAEGTAGGDDEVRTFSWMEETEVDGEKVESALIFSFKKADGQYRLFRVVAAG